MEVTPTALPTTIAASASLASEAAPTPCPAYYVAISYVRGFLVILVLAHRSASAYVVDAPPQALSLEG